MRQENQEIRGVIILVRHLSQGNYGSVGDGVSRAGMPERWEPGVTPKLGSTLERMEGIQPHHVARVQGIDICHLQPDTCTRQQISDILVKDGRLLQSCVCSVVGGKGSSSAK